MGVEGGGGITSKVRQFVTVVITYETDTLDIAAYHIILYHIRP